MRILHTSDWHLGISLNNASLMDEQRFFLTQLREIIKCEAVDGVAVAGDIFDSSVSSAEAIELYNCFATMICKELNTPMIVIAGNHDGQARLSSMRELLQNSGLYVVGKLTSPISPVEIGDVLIYQIPYFNIDEIRYLYPDKEIKTYENAMNVICDSIRATMDKTKKNMVVAHAFVSGGELSESDHSAIIGTANMVSKDVFKGFDYVALGHLHRPQSITSTIRYSGTPIKYSFSEVNQEKSVSIYDFDTKELKICPLKQKNDLVVVHGTLEEIMSATEIDERFAKIEVTDKYIGIDILDGLRSLYPNFLSVSGKNAEASIDNITLSVEEIQSLSPDKIVEKFFIETFDYSPTTEQINMYLDAMNEMKESDLS